MNLQKFYNAVKTEGFLSSYRIERHVGIKQSTFNRWLNRKSESPFFQENLILKYRVELVRIRDLINEILGEKQTNEKD